jgi:glycine dehydrogenase subunit 2
MKEYPGTTGLILNEPLLWEKGKKGRCGFSMPQRDVESFEVDESLVGDVLQWTAACIRWAPAQ